MGGAKKTGVSPASGFDPTAGYAKTYTIKEGRMRIFILVLATLCVLVVSAQPQCPKHCQWQDGTLVNITDDAPGVASNAPETVYRYHIRRAYYWVEVGDMTYVLVNSWSVGFHSPKAPLNVTLNGKVKIAIEKQNAYILDDSGKEIERPLVAKIAQPATPK
jgi:hypothetical protein